MQFRLKEKILRQSIKPTSGTSAPYTLPSHNSGVSVPITITHQFANGTSQDNAAFLSAFQTACKSASTGSVQVDLVVDAGLDVWSKFNYIGNTPTTADWPCYA